jgi:multidrug resistance efflux pump
MNPPAVIPRPWRYRWLDFRLRGVPPIVIGATFFAVLVLWTKNWTPSTFIGEVQAPTATVTSPQVGLLTELHVAQFAHVQRGQIVAIIRITSPDSLKAAATAIRSDLDIMRARLALDQSRNNQNQDRFRLDWLSQRVDLATARANLQFAESELTRSEHLFRDGIVSISEYELVKDRRDALAVEVQERQHLVSELEQIVTTSDQGSSATENPLILATINAAILAQENALRQSEGPIRLEAPIDGTVTAVYRRPGETVMAGEPLVLINGHHPDQIIGYVRQPIAFEPKSGDTVEVRTRGYRRQVGISHVTAVGNRLELFAVSTSGAQLELFTQPLGLRGLNGTFERGIPVRLDIPANMRLYPGELVDLILKATD